MKSKAAAVALSILACMCSYADAQCPQKPQAVEENDLYSVECTDSNITIISALPVDLADVAVSGKSLFLYGYEDSTWKSEWLFLTATKHSSLALQLTKCLFARTALNTQAHSSSACRREVLGKLTVVCRSMWTEPLWSMVLTSQLWHVRYKVRKILSV